ncbi:MAG: hypothetical protein ACXAD7_19070 [Candidatus Kariarchaeaceae archaeon]|jgi:hypothetical protein
MPKGERLTFRISPELNKRIEIAVTQSEGSIRDRSELGTKAIQFFLEYLRGSVDQREAIIQAIVALAKLTETSSPEIQILESIYRNSEPLEKESHPKYEEILILKERFTTEIQDEIDDQLKAASFDDIDQINNFYKEKFYLEGIEQKRTIKKEQTQINT